MIAFAILKANDKNVISVSVKILHVGISQITVTFKP